MTKNIKLNGLMEMTSKIDIAFIITISFLFGLGVGEQGDYKEAKTVFDVIVALGTGVLAFVAVFSFNSWKDQYKTSRQTECVKAIRSTIYDAQEIDDEIIMNLEKQMDLEWRLEKISNDIEKISNDIDKSVNSVSSNSEIKKIITKLENSNSIINLKNTWLSEIYELTAIKSELFRRQGSATHQLDKKCIELNSINGQLDLKKIITNRKNMTSQFQNNENPDLDKINKDQLVELKTFYSIANPFLK